MLIIMAGLPGTGKSTLGRAVAERVGAHVLDKDRVREAMFGALTDFTTEQDDVVVETMLRAAEYLWRTDPRRSIVLDGRVFSKNAQVERVKEFATGCGQEWRVVECVCSPEAARSRIEEDRESGRHVAGNRTRELYDEVRARFEEIPGPKLMVDTERPLTECVSEVMMFVGAIAAR